MRSPSAPASSSGGAEPRPDGRETGPSMKSDVDWAELLNRLDEGVALLDERCRIVFASDRFNSIFPPAGDDSTEHGAEPPMLTEWLGSRISDSSAMTAAMNALNNDGRPAGPIYLKTREHPPRTIRIRLVPLTGSAPQRPGCLVTALDMTGDDGDFQLDEGFLSVLSHDIRSPLTSILGFARLALDDLVRVSDQASWCEHREFLEFIVAETDRLSAMIRRIVEVGRLQRGVVERDFQPVDLVQLLEPVLEAAARRARDENRRLAVRFAPDVAVIRGDALRLRDMIGVLIDNAFKFTQSGGRINFSLLATESRAIVEISDDGCGIAPEDTPLIFNRFYRGRHSTGPKSGGLGLGLTLAREIARMHGGTIEVDSRPGEGATFRVQLPLSRERERP
ncbi:MAG: hypothetical protein Kow0059_08560 [Candidatus Sumerlaeia bacterium]